MKALEKSQVNESRIERLRHFELVAVMGTGTGFFPVYASFVVAAILIIHPSVSQGTSVLWAAIYLLYTTVRTIATSLYHQDANHADPRRVNHWRRFVFFSALAHGLILGSLAVIALPLLNPSRQLVLTCFVLLVTTGAVIYVSAILPALWILITATLLPFAFVWESQHNTLELPIGMFLYAAWILNLFMSWIHHRASSRLFILAADNEFLVRALEQKNRELETADRARVQLLAVTSHDLRQPVHALRLILAHASEYDDTRTLRQHFEKLREVSNLIAQMLIEVMDLSTLEHETYSKRLEAVSLKRILHQLKTSQEPLAIRKGLELDIQNNKEIWVQADASLLRRMLLNLLSNAIKYTAVGRVILECNVQESHVVISVRDTGVGIPTARLDDIFKPYVRLDPLVTDKDGVGLGLSIVRRAAVVQGFEVHVASTMGVGSVFEVNVPLSENQLSHSTFDETAPYNPPSPDVLIAVLDDDFFAREALVTLLKRWGYSTTGGATLAELKEALNDGRKPSLIITDNYLSQFELGPDVILAIREYFNDFSIAGVVMTGDTNVVLDGLSQVELVYKPLDPVSLKKLVLRMLMNVSAADDVD